MSVLPERFCQHLPALFRFVRLVLGDHRAICVFRCRRPVVAAIVCEGSGDYSDSCERHVGDFLEFGPSVVTVRAV